MNNVAVTSICSWHSRCKKKKKKNCEYLKKSCSDSAQIYTVHSWIVYIIQLLKLVSSADWSKVHHVTMVFWARTGHYGHYQPVIIRLSRPVVIHANASYRFCTALSMAYACRIRIRKYSCSSCARFLIVEPTERLIRVKAGRKMSKNLWNYIMHLSVLQGKTSLLQIVIHLFLLLFHRVYFLFCWPFQLNLSFKTLFAIRFWPCYQSSVYVYCIHVLVHLNTLVPLTLHCPCLRLPATTVTMLCA